MLTTQQKTEQFKKKSSQNYLASLSLEGMTVTKSTPGKKIADLNAKYAR